LQVISVFNVETKITGRWLNFGVLAMTVMLDLNTVRYHVQYRPVNFGQMYHPATRFVYNVAADSSLTPVSAMYRGYSVWLKLACASPALVGVLLFARLFIGMREKQSPRPAPLFEHMMVDIPPAKESQITSWFAKKSHSHLSSLASPVDGRLVRSFNVPVRMGGMEAPGTPSFAPPQSFGSSVGGDNYPAIVPMYSISSAFEHDANTIFMRQNSTASTSSGGFFV
jgi:hypothetical protein